MKKLFLITAVIEAGTGILLLAAPSAISALLLGAPLESPAAQTVARVAGAALLALAVGCGRSSGDGRGMVTAMLIYNIAVTAILLHAHFGLGQSGIGLWPVVALHIGLAGWCAANLRSRVTN